ncbi:MAG: hypothetical protein R2762_17590 [Bryobacteraceae bacterium]
MATERQLAANRQNARKSTGPRTAEGKRRVARNAIKHGLYATDSVVYAIGETSNSFQKHIDVFLSTALDPGDPIETSLLKNIAALDWQVSRVRRQEAGSSDALAQDLWDRSVAQSPDPSLSPTFGPFDESSDRGPNRLAGLTFVASATATDAPEKLSRIQQRLFAAYFRALKTLADYRNKPNSHSRNPRAANEKAAA